ncbi:aminodeoxychorismate lyase [Nocardia terpenica]|uniref:endolytic transglycosylase MltG n=1 Tax=Nocardia terpenica TaxID=455432 RepID=UPI002FE1A664
MNDRWARAEERYRQQTEQRRYRRSDHDWGDYDDDPEDYPPPRGRASHRAAPADDWDDYEDDTTVIPRYSDDDPPPDLPPRRSPRGGQRGGRADQRRGRGDERGRGEERGGRSQPPRSRRSRVASRKAAERRRRRRNLLILGGVFLVLFVAAGGYAGYKFIGRLGGPADFSGPTGPLAVVQVQRGDTSEDIAKSMVAKGVVESTGAFYEAAVRNSSIQSVQPGYYAVPTHSKGADAVAALVGKQARVGNVVVAEGKRLHDSTDANTHARNDGIYRKIAEASCVGTGTAKKCVTYEQLDAAGGSTDLASLGVPAWAMDAVSKVPDRSRQLEGLIAAGSWDFDPTGTPQQILKQLVSASARSYESTGIVQSGGSNGLTPYQTIIGASLVEREVQVSDMPKVARVILNRLRDNQKLEFDSTVNYTLDQTAVATTDQARTTQTPWNTYAMTGLPATPISSPSLDALRAMEKPAEGSWLYFVTVNKNGETLFTDSYTEHQKNVKLAQRSGILDNEHGQGTPR